MPAVEQVKLKGNPVGAIPVLAFGKTWIKAKDGLAGDVVDVLLHRELEQQADVDHPCCLEQTFVITPAIAALQFSTDAVVFPQKHQAEGHITHRRIAPFQTGGIQRLQTTVDLVIAQAALTKAAPE